MRTLNAAVLLIAPWLGLAALRAHPPASHGSPETAAQDSMPASLRNEMTQLTQGSGRWIVDNHAYRNDDEPWDQYGTEWSWGLGQQTVRGRLYAVVGGRDVRTFWEFRLFWHPGERRAILQQFGSDGTVGIGPMVQEGTEVFVDQTFDSPDGTSYRVGHRSSFAGDIHITESLNRVGDRWEKRRRYEWKRTP